jgi:hypothetical protein
VTADPARTAWVIRRTRTKRRSRCWGVRGVGVIRTSLDVALKDEAVHFVRSLEYWAARATTKSVDDFGQANREPRATERGIAVHGDRAVDLGDDLGHDRKT